MSILTNFQKGRQAGRQRQQQSRLKFGWKTKLLALIGFIIIVIGLLTAIVRRANEFFDTHTLQFNQVVQIAFNRPIEVVERQPEVIEVVLDYPDDIDTPLEQYICDKWGAYDCKTALAIAKAESGFREDAVGINGNGTIDVGIFQINSVHFDKEGCSLKELADAESNVDCAYQIWEASGWSPWVVYQKGTYLNHVE